MPGTRLSGEGAVSVVLSLSSTPGLFVASSTALGVELGDGEVHDQRGGGRDSPRRHRWGRPISSAEGCAVAYDPDRELLGE